MKEHPLDTTGIRKLSDNLQHSIDQLEGFRVIQSKAPFFLVEMQTGKAAQLKQFLLDEHQVLIRDASNFRGLNDQHFRVCTRSESDNLLLVKGLTDYKNKSQG